jgi:hypothetical protein
VDLSPYVEQLRRELAVAADLGGEETRALADRLATPLESAVRLALLSALSAAAEEITGQLAPGAVDVRLRGGDIGFVVTPPPAPTEDDHHDPVPPSSDRPEPEIPESDEGSTSRVTLRLPEQLKTRIEDAARREGFSLNTWLVRAVTRALDPGTAGGSERRRTRWSGQQYSGWVR